MSAAALKQIDLFERRLPPRPLCGDEFADGLYRLPKKFALQKKHVQINSQMVTGVLCFDIDREMCAFAWEQANLPPPSFIVQNPKNGHCHFLYLLTGPIDVSGKDPNKNKAVRFLAAVQYAYTKALGADFNYSNFTAKTPCHEAWITHLFAQNDGLYDLAYLADYVELPKTIPKRREAVGAGRNCSLFDDLSRWSWRAVRPYWRPNGEKAWAEAVFLRAQELNVFETPLSVGEVRCIARNVSRWVWRNITPAGFHEVQRKRGKVGNKKSVAVRAKKSAERAKEAKALIASGLKQKEVAEKLGVSVRTIKRFVASS